MYVPPGLVPLDVTSSLASLNLRANLEGFEHLALARHLLVFPGPGGCDNLVNFETVHFQ